MEDDFPVSNDDDEESGDDNDSDLEAAEPKSEADAMSETNSEEGVIGGDEAEDGDNEDEENDDDSGSKKTVYGNFGWADAMSKVLKVGKPKAKKSIILAKAKTDADVMKTIASATKEEPLSFVIDGEIKETKPEVKEEEKKGILWEEFYPIMQLTAKERGCWPKLEQEVLFSYSIQLKHIRKLCKTGYRKLVLWRGSEKRL